jgi:hypothetical protein
MMPFFPFNLTWIPAIWPASLEGAATILPALPPPLRLKSYGQSVSFHFFMCGRSD